MCFLYYQNREIYDSYGNTVKYSSFMIQDSKHEKLPLAVDICASDAGSVLYRRSFAIENGTLIFGVLCEVEL